ncbi:MAG: ribbon-helix-helix protein, CopG family [Draconibacterium sp.]|nr:ribbon-helix-helix protein, CopG family [Draconibacterium sp.]
MPVTRFGVSTEEDILNALDKLVISNQFPSRSKAIRYLIKNFLVTGNWDMNKIVAGAIVIVYNQLKKE